MPQSFSLSSKEKKLCINIARESIKHFFDSGNYLEFCSDCVPKKLQEKKACFVTLKLNGQLKGCIGHLQSFQPLYLDIIQNSVAAAFQDPRFVQLSEEEFPLIKIEVSVLTDPTPLKYSSPKDLIKKIRQGKDGLIIKKGAYSATFLPSVWEEITNKEDFLSHLCAKAGLHPDEWTKGTTLKVERYEAIKMEEGK